MGFIFLCPCFRLLFAFASSVQKKNHEDFYFRLVVVMKIRRKAHTKQTKKFFSFFATIRVKVFFSQQRPWACVAMKGFVLEGYDWNVRRHKQNSPGITLRRSLIPYNEEATAESLGQFSAFFQQFHLRIDCIIRGWVRMWGYVTFLEEGHWNSWNSSTS